MFQLGLYNKWRQQNDENFLELLEPNKEAMVADLGCGDGTFTLRVKERIGCSRIIGVDVYKPCVQTSSSEGIQMIMHNLNVFPYPFADESFDVIVSNQVIEHLFFPVRFLEEIHRILKHGGYLVLSTENLASWDNVISLLFGFAPFSLQLDSRFTKLGSISHSEKHKIVDMFGKEVDSIGEDHYPHVRVLAFRTIKLLFSFLGFKIIRTLGSGHLLGLDVIQPSRCRFVTIKGKKD